jgi:beta-aspartyl-peptidase (threonine type)
MIEMIVLASTNGSVGIQESWRVLQAGGSAVEAVEAGIRLVEANPDDHSVGLGGYPDLLGQVELDAGIMDGRDLTAGAVAALRNFQHPISVARKVMERLPHVLLVGGGAERFAAEMGFERVDLLTEEVRGLWREHLQEILPGEILGRLDKGEELWRWVDVVTDPGRTTGTVNFLALDRKGNLCAGVSTSGWPWRYPGRVGDSPIIGAGLYADNRYGAAACTGMGEMAIRAGTARGIVHYLRMGSSVEEAGRQAMEDLNDLGGRYQSRMNLLVMDREGRHAGFSSAEAKSYIYITEGMDEPQEWPRHYVPVEERWIRNLT